MVTRSIHIAPGEFYHIYNRGVDKRTIFERDADYQRFLDLLFLCNSTESVSLRDVYRTQDSVYEYERGNQLVSIGAYCLMPNHFHILLTSDLDNGIATFMNKVCTGYTMYFNKKYDRTGALLQGTYKAEHAHHDEYLKYLYAYIHLNPVQLIQSNWKEVGIRNTASALKHCREYSFSSLKEYVAQPENPSKITNSEPFPDYFTVTADHDRELLDWLTYS